MKTPINFLSAFAALAILAGCSSGPVDFTRDYDAALRERPGVALADASEGRRLSARFASLYCDLSPRNVKARVRSVYAPDAWFNDTIATEVGIDAIERYLLKTAEGAQSVSAAVEDVAVSGPDCYVRWTMKVQAQNLAGGQPITTKGLSQLRFDADGKIVFHQDFWNPAAGIYQQLPLIGPAIRHVNRLIVGDVK